MEANVIWVVLILFIYLFFAKMEWFLVLEIVFLDYCIKDIVVCLFFKISCQN